MSDTTTVIIGAGIVGLACARALARAGDTVFVLEAADTWGTQTSARNSEVIHSGIYYPHRSLKAELCVRGRRLLYAYCHRHDIPYRRCGKLVLATDVAQIPALRALERRGLDNGVADIQWLTAPKARAMEPALRCAAALYSPSTGIVDSHALMRAFVRDIRNEGGHFVPRTRVLSIAHDVGAHCTKHRVAAINHDGTQSVLVSDRVINAAGHGAVALACHIEGLDPRHIPRSFYAKGNYFSLHGKSPFSHLIYPLPTSGGLGVHLTLDLAGRARFGPDVRWVDSDKDLTVDTDKTDAFYDAVRPWWPALPAGALAPDYAGIRPKIAGPKDPDADFVLQGPDTHGLSGLVNLFGIESPGLTSALAIGEAVVHALDDHR